ncbi:hypothetical protein [Nannocystis pusilla]|uniref:hypothetical protein n=1 Tax=Nannocystis pusilla TaxID=889268 RepID=UPI003B7A6EF6
MSTHFSGNAMTLVTLPGLRLLTATSGAGQRRAVAHLRQVIGTSTGPGDIRPWGQDECVVWHTAHRVAVAI